MEKIKKIQEEISKIEIEKEKLIAPLNEKIKALNKELEKAVEEMREREVYPKIRELTDKLFSLPENKDCNILVLKGIHTDYNDSSWVFSNYTWDEKEKVKISINGRYNKWAEAIEYSDDSNTIVKELENLILFELLPDIEELYKEEGVNCYWHGIIALRNDSKLVGFICRNDNVMLNDYANEPDILLDFNK